MHEFKHFLEFHTFRNQYKIGSGSLSLSLHLCVDFVLNIIDRQRSQQDISFCRNQHFSCNWLYTQKNESHIYIIHINLHRLSIAICLFASIPEYILTLSLLQFCFTSFGHVDISFINHLAIHLYRGFLFFRFKWSKIPFANRLIMHIFHLIDAFYKSYLAFITLLEFRHKLNVRITR